EAGAVEVAQPDQRPAELVVDELRQPRGLRAEDLGAPLELLEPRKRDELLERVPRASARRRPGRVVRKRIASAERAAGEDPRHVRVEGGQEALDVPRRTEVARSGIAVGRNDVVAERFEGRELVSREEAAGERSAGSLEAWPRGCKPGDRRADGCE